MPPLRHRAALLLSAACLAVLAQLHDRVRALTGELTFPLDDAYIHLALAQNLVHSGTWGVNPGEFASASSSPLWTALLALGFATAGGSLWLPLGLNALALPASLLAASFLLREERPWVRAATLLTLALATPLPFLAGLGMEHTLHLALVLALLATTESRAAAESKSRSAAHSPIALLPLAALAGAAALTRYETLFLLGGLTLAFGRPAARTLTAAWAGAACAVTGFGLWSVSHGAAFLPNPVLKKGWASRDWQADLREALTSSPALLALMLAAAIALGFGLSTAHRRRVIVLLAAAAGQLVLGRVGWLYRYEAWLVALGVLVVVPLGAEMLRRGPRIVPLWLLTALAPPLFARADAAFGAFTPAARSTFDTNVVPARWLASTFPGVPLAVHDLGAMAFYTRGPLIDLAGLGSDDVARLHREGRLSDTTLAPILAGGGVNLAITGEDWLGNARPASFEPVARIVVPYPVFPGTFHTRVWARPPERAAAVRAALAQADWSPRVSVVLSTDVPVALDAATLMGPAVAVEAQGLSFYGNGSATLTLPAAGQLRIHLAGTEAEGRFPRVRLELPGRTEEVEAPEAGVVQSLGMVAAGDLLVVRFDDDGEDAQGGDRNLTVRSLYIRP